MNINIINIFHNVQRMQIWLNQMIRRACVRFLLLVIISGANVQDPAAVE